MYNIALCPHGQKTGGYVVGSMTSYGNVTLFTSRTSGASWPYHCI